MDAIFGILTVSEHYTQNAVDALKAAGFDARTLYDDEVDLWSVLARVSGTETEIAAAEDRIMDIGDPTGTWDGRQPDSFWERAQPT